jgi:glycosyltransferase involved in cell wall biosynthesis
MRFVYDAGTAPDALNGAFPGDEVRGAAGADPAQWPMVTVVLPGRNEGHLLARTLGSLCAMDYPRFRVFFVDDQSTDNTAAVCGELAARFSHLTVIHNTEPPRDGWVGKSWAVHQAEPHLHEGDYLLFTDADLEYHPACLRHMVRLALHRESDLVSLLPRIRYETLGELLGLLAAMTIINTRLSLYHCNNPRIPRALVAGGFLLVKREVYHAMGGHAAVRGQMVEDVALGTRAKALGRRVFTAITHDLYTARMYEGWADTFRGLKKNAYAGANYNPLFAVAIGLFLLLAGVLPPVYAALGIMLWIVDPTLVTFGLCAAGILSLLAEIAVGKQTARYVGMRERVGYLLPAGMGFYLAVFIGSVIDHYRGGNTWAGRRVAKAEPLSSAGRVEVR